MLIELEPPTQLSFHRPFTQLVKETLVIRNPNSEPVAFKVKTTAPKRYCVRPNTGRIEANQSVKVQVILQPMKAPDFICKDKFLVLSAAITAERETLSLVDFWFITEQQAKDTIEQNKLRCVYLPQVADTVAEILNKELYLPVLNNLESLFKSKKNYDVIIQAGEGNNQKEIYAHSFILCCQSNYFEAAFSSNWAEKKNGKYFFKKPNVLPHVFEIIIRYLYCGQINLSVVSESDITKLLVATDELGLEILNTNIQKFLIDKQKELLRKDPIEILEMKLFLPVLNNLEYLFKSKKDCDVIIQAGEGNDQKEIYAHSLILCCQSNYFDTAFSTNWAEKENGKYIFKKPNISPNNFETILRYLYCGKMDLKIESGPDVILKLLVATDKFVLDTLNEYIQKFLIKNRKKFLKNDPIGVLEIAFQHETFTALTDYCLETICQEPGILFGTDKILMLPAQILESLLKREDLVLDEIEVWNNLIKWAHAQQPTVNKDPFKWTKDELTLMERTLLRFIPLIRFHDIPSGIYYNKVVPCDVLLPKELRHEILQFYLDPDIKQVGSLPSRSGKKIKREKCVIQ